MSNNKQKVISLNLVYDYPVQWSKFKVLRDFVQNFYDSVSWREWDRRFSWRITKDELVLVAKDVGFSYDWLLHIGASTKREDEHDYAGHFGEGFKIAALCAIRDFGWTVVMSSRDWYLQVIKTDLLVDGQTLPSLGYRIGCNKQPANDTILRISPFFDKELMDCVILSFYSPANPLLGSKIFESAESAVYLRSNKSKPFAYPQTFDNEGPGIIFAGYQALGSFRDRLVFCLHRYQYNDRERNNFFTMDVIKIISQAVATLPPEASATILRILRSRWYDRPHKKYDFESWSGIIAQLITRMSQSPSEAQKFRSEFPNLLVARLVKRSTPEKYNLRRQARDWLKSCGQPYRLVQEAFSQLGYPSLEEACDIAGGFSVIREPDESELEWVGLIEKMAHTIFANLFQITGMPPCKIIKNEKSAWQGMTNCIPLKEKPYYNGLLVHFRLSYVAFKASLLHKDRFGEALSTYTHELAHVFGGDHSASYSRGLTELMEILLKNVSLIAECQHRWEQAGK
jgi:hypothetical protein